MPDFLASLLVFTIILSVFLFSWDSVIANQDKFGQGESIRAEAEHTTTFLVSTPGYPDDWNSTNVDIPGFAESENVLDTEKIEEFGELDYQEQRGLLLAYHYRLVFEDSEGEVIETEERELDFGLEPEQESSTVVPVTRTVLLDFGNRVEEAEMRYVVWL